MAVPSRSNTCPICGNTLWKTYDVGIIPDYGRANLFAVPCEKCRAKYRAADETGIPSEYCDADLSKFKNCNGYPAQSSFILYSHRRRCYTDFGK